MVIRDGGRIRFLDRFQSRGVNYFLRHVDEALAKGYTDIVLDFSEVKGAFVDSMLPVITTADWLRANGSVIGVDLPRDQELHRLFLNTCWAHYLDPKVYSARDVNVDHFNARRFSDAKQQQRVVNEIMRLAVAKLHLSKDELTALEWSVNEITDNVLTHADSTTGGIVQVQTMDQGVWFCVADAGRGILNSMREGHPHLRNDAQAIGEAVKAGVTRNPKVGQGNGLAGTLRISSLSGGEFHIRSHRGRLAVERTQARTFHCSETERLKGTMVAACIRTSGTLNINEALGFTGMKGEPMNILDFHEEEAESMVMRLAAETEGVGSRPAGAFIREKCRHLLAQDPNKPLILDWAGVPVVSSSFADEAFGKLFAEMGPLVFGARIKHRAMEPVNQALVNKAIVQRIAQLGAGLVAKPEPSHAGASKGRRRRWRRRARGREGRNT
jgi:anti-sigma regulatory factor (Ser/Thr protein kinase)